MSAVSQIEILYLYDTQDTNQLITLQTTSCFSVPVVLWQRWLLRWKAQISLNPVEEGSFRYGLNCLPSCNKICCCCYIKCFGSNYTCLPSDFMEVIDHIHYNVMDLERFVGQRCLERWPLWCIYACIFCGMLSHNHSLFLLYLILGQIKKEYGNNVVPAFPPKKIFTLTPAEVEQRREQLEKYMQAGESDVMTIFY